MRGGRVIVSLDREEGRIASWRTAFGQAWLPATGCLVGILFANHPMLFSGLSRIQLNHEDPRLINYLLEHGYLWLRGTPLHRELWNPPFYFPATNVLAYSDTMLARVRSTGP